MRAVAALLAFVFCGCKSNPDPDWSKPCAEQRPPSVEVGTGTTGFVRIDATGISIEVDNTGTYVWLGVSVQGFGPDVDVSGSIKDAKSAAELATLASTSRTLAYDQPSDRDVAAGLELVVTPTLAAPLSIETIVGKDVTVSAQVSGCGARKGSNEVATVISGFDTTTCQGCLYQACATQLAACDADCTAIQACLDTHCTGLSANGSSDEPTCVAYCEGLHPNGKANYVALAMCVQKSPCEPPCEAYPYDYNDCLNVQNAEGTGPCWNAYEPCSAASGDCVSYTSCINGCTTWAGCQACAKQSPAGEMLYEAYESCIENACLVLAALPQ
jgi:hypothetical protein